MSNKPDPSLLLHPNIPKPLHGIAPRVIMGKEWWDKNRREAYANAGYCCEACGVHKSQAKYHQWLEAHEIYDMDYTAGKMTFVRLVALCHSCHNYIHNGRMMMMVDQGNMSEEKYYDIERHGINLLVSNGLPPRARRPKGPIAEWSKFRMVFEGKEYGPSSKNYNEWLIGKWKY